MQYSIKDFWENKKQVGEKEINKNNLTQIEKINVNVQQENLQQIDQQQPTQDQQTPTEMTMPSQTDYSLNKDMELMKKLYTDINTFLLPFVLEVLDEFEHEGSPIYKDIGITRETLAQIVDKVINMAEEVLDQVGEAKNERTGNYIREWDRWGLLRAVVESLVLNEVFGVRRNKYFNLKDKIKEEIVEEILD